MGCLPRHERTCADRNRRGDTRRSTGPGGVMGSCQGDEAMMNGAREGRSDEGAHMRSIVEHSSLRGSGHGRTYTYLKRAGCRCFSTGSVVGDASSLSRGGTETSPVRILLYGAPASRSKERRLALLVLPIHPDLISHPSLPQLAQPDTRTYKPPKFMSAPFHLSFLPSSLPPSPPPSLPPYRSPNPRMSGRPRLSARGFDPHLDQKAALALASPRLASAQSFSSPPLPCLAIGGREGWGS